MRAKNELLHMCISHIYANAACAHTIRLLLSRSIMPGPKPRWGATGRVLAVTMRCAVFMVAFNTTYLYGGNWLDIGHLGTVRRIHGDDAHV